MTDGGKGSAPRPIPDRKKFEENWDKIFTPPKEKQDDRSAEQERGKDT